MLPRYHAPDMEVWGGKQSGYCGFKPEVISWSSTSQSLNSQLQCSIEYGFDLEGTSWFGWNEQRPPCENPDYMWGLDHSRNNHYTTTYGQANQTTITCRARLKHRPPIVRPPYPHEDPKVRMLRSLPPKFLRKQSVTPKEWLDIVLWHDRQRKESKASSTRIQTRPPPRKARLVTKHAKPHLKLNLNYLHSHN